MDKQNLEFLSTFNVDDIPWNRLFTAYGTAENYPEYIGIIESMNSIDEMKEALERISDFEHQSTLFAPAPFTIAILLKVFKKAKSLNTPEAIWLTETLSKDFEYYLEICSEAEQLEHAEVLPIKEIFGEKYLLSNDSDEDDIEEFLENIDDMFIPDDYFYTLYHCCGELIRNSL